MKNLHISAGLGMVAAALTLSPAASDPGALYRKMKC